MASFNVSEKWADDINETPDVRAEYLGEDRPSGAHPVGAQSGVMVKARVAEPDIDGSHGIDSEACAQSPLLPEPRTPSGIYERREDASSVAPTLLPQAGIDLRGAVEVFENNLIRQALERTRWNKNQAAKLLGLNRTTLVEMLKRKGIRAA